MFRIWLSQKKSINDVLVERFHQLKLERIKFRCWRWNRLLSKKRQPLTLPTSCVKQPKALSFKILASPYVHDDWNIAKSGPLHNKIVFDKNQATIPFVRQNKGKWGTVAYEYRTQTLAKLRKFNPKHITSLCLEPLPSLTPTERHSCLFVWNTFIYRTENLCVFLCVLPPELVRIIAEYL